MQVEQDFWQLVAKWKILREGLNFNVDVATRIICCAMKLHNFCVENPDVVYEEHTDVDRGELTNEIHEWFKLSKQDAREGLEGDAQAVDRYSQTRQDL